jgi:hypothetical protein
MLSGHMTAYPDVGIPRRPVPLTERGGVPSVAVFGGYPQTVETSGELVGQRRYKTFSEILANTSIVAASVRHYLNLLGNATWALEAAPTRGGEKVAKFVEQALFHDPQTPWHRIVRSLSMYRFYGFSVHEWTLRARDDGRLTYDDIEVRSQNTVTRFDVDPKDGELRGIVQESPWDGRSLYIPRTKLLYAVDDSLSASPEGLGMFRHVIDSARRLRIYNDLECYGYETDLRGIPVGRAPIQAMKDMNWTADEINAALAGLNDFLEGHRRTPQLSLLLDSMTYETRDESATPSSNKQWDVDLLKSSSQGHEHIAVAIERLNREIARALGSESILTGESGSGSLAMARDKSQTFALTVAASLQEMREVLQRDLVRPILRVNGIPEKLMPQLKPDAIQHRSVTEITAAIKDLASTGYTLAPNDPVVAKLFDMLGLPKGGLSAVRPPKAESVDSGAPPSNETNDDESE